MGEMVRSWLRFAWRHDIELVQQDRFSVESIQYDGSCDEFVVMDFLWLFFPSKKNASLAFARFHTFSCMLHRTGKLID